MIDEWNNGAKYWNFAWNPMIGCRKISEGCANCYAERLAMRYPELRSPNGKFDPHCPKTLKRPPQKGVVFVGNMTDIFGEWNDWPQILDWLLRLHDSAENLILTKRPERMAKLIAGFGMNWQRCSKVIFLGLSDSYEQFYQAVRRFYRFGQKRTVHVWIVTADTEGAVVENIRRKERDANAMYAEMVKYMNGENRIAVTGNAPKRSVYAPQQNIQMPTFLKGAAAI